jgi:hypothetical protein
MFFDLWRGIFLLGSKNAGDINRNQLIIDRKLLTVLAFSLQKSNSKARHSSKKKNSVVSQLQLD